MLTSYPIHDVKHADVAQVAQWMVALANTNGGQLIGVSSLLGVEASQRCIPPVVYYQHFENGIHVPRSAQLHAIEDGSVYVDTIDGIMRLDRDGIQQLASVRALGDFDREAVPGTTIENLKSGLMADFAGCSKEELSQFGFVAKDSQSASVAGILFFSENPQHWLPQSAIEVLHYPSSRASAQASETIQPFPHHIETGTLISLIDQTSALLERITTNYPPEVLREIIINAVSHREYRIQAPIRIGLYSDCIEIESPGHLPAFTNVKNLEQVYFSRNLLITQTLARLGYGQTLGQGIRAVKTMLNKANLREPQFLNLPQSFSVTLWRKAVVAEEKSRSALISINETQMRILQYIREYGSITEWELAVLFPKIPADKIQSDLLELEDKKQILKLARVRGKKQSTCFVLHQTISDDSVE